MQIYNGELYWPTTYTREEHTNPAIASFYDVVIVGGGMSGMLTAHALVGEGLKVALLDKRKPGEGSSAANTGILQYCNDIMLYELIKQIGEQDAVRFYQICYEAIQELAEIVRLLPDQADFIKRPSVYFASKKRDMKKLQKEYEVLKQHGFPCEILAEEEVWTKFGVKKAGAIITYEDAEVNPYKFVVGLSERLKQQGLHIFENTTLNIIEEKKDDFTLHTIEGIIKTKRLVYTTGYEKVPFGKIKGANIRRTYAIVTNEIPDLQPWFERALLWETARPYFYLRTTVDNRIIVGGLDEGKAKPPKNPKKLDKKAEQLLNVLKNMLPQYDLEAEFIYGASFGESKDNLPFIGEHPHHRGHYYMLGYGGNGTVYSLIGSRIVADLIMERPNDDVHIVTTHRKYGVK